MKTLNNLEPLQKWNLTNSLDVTYVNRHSIKNELISYVITINYSGLLMQQLNVGHLVLEIKSTKLISFNWNLWKKK